MSSVTQTKRKPRRYSPKNAKRREKYHTQILFRTATQRISRLFRRKSLDGSKSKDCSGNLGTAEKKGEKQKAVFPNGKVKTVSLMSAPELAAFLDNYSVGTIYDWWQKGWLPRPVVRARDADTKHGKMFYYTAEEVEIIASIIADHQKVKYYLMANDTGVIRALRNRVIAYRKNGGWHVPDVLEFWKTGEYSDELSSKSEHVKRGTVIPNSGVARVRRRYE